MRLQIENLSYRVRGHNLISDLSLTSDGPHCTALLGENGAGKTLLMRLCHGLLKPNSGRVLWDGHPPSVPFGRITMVFQKPVLLRRSARANIEHALYLHGVPRIARRARAEAALEAVNLSDCSEHPAFTLSGGQQQRLVIARAWALKPAVILMDEPTSKLDMRSTAIVEKLITDLAASGVKIIMTSHNLAQVRRLCAEVVFLHRGRLLCCVAADDFFATPGAPEIREFIHAQEF